MTRRAAARPGQAHAAQLFATAHMTPLDTSNNANPSQGCFNMRMAMAQERAHVGCRQGASTALGCFDSIEVLRRGDKLELRGDLMRSVLRFYFSDTSE